MDTENLVLAKTDPTSKHYQYLRSQCPSMGLLQKKLAKSYQCESCEITASGTAAIYAIISAIFAHHQFKKINIMMADQTYSSTPTIAKFFCDTYAPTTTTHYVDVKDSTGMLALFEEYQGDCNILYLESCSNAFGNIFDFNLIPTLRKLSGKLHVIVDNTWLTEFIFNPLLYDVDFVVLSLTKYYAAGHAIGGAVLAKNHKEIMDLIFLHRKMTGSHVSPHTCDIILTHIDKLQSRINKLSKLIAYLFENWTHPKVVSIIHPFFENHTSHKTMLTYFAPKKYPSVFLITIKKLSSQHLTKIIKKCAIFEYKTSFGASRSRIDPYIFCDNKCSYIRIALGFGDTPEQIVNGMNELLNQL